MNLLAKNIEKALKLKGLTAYQASLAAGKNKQFVADILAGRAKSTTHENLTDLARALEVPVSQLTGAKPEYTPDLEIMFACFQWVLENFDRFRDVKTDAIIQELKIQYTHMLNERINDKREAINITSYIFESLLAKAKPVKRKPSQK